MAKRARKEPEKLTYEEPDPKVDKMLPGSGAALADIEEVKHMLSQTKRFSDGVEALHWLIFKSKGKQGQQRKNLRTFSGFLFKDDPEIERQRFLDRSYGLHAQVREMMDVLVLDRSPKSFDDGKDSKENMCERLIEFLECPKESLGKKSKVAKDPAPRKATKSIAEPAEDDLTTKLLRAIARRQLQFDESDGDPSIREIVKNAEDYVGAKLPKIFKGIVKQVIEDETAPAYEAEDEEAEEEDEGDAEDDKATDEPAAKKAKKTSEKNEKATTKAEADDMAHKDVPETSDTMAEIDDKAEEPGAEKQPGRKDNQSKATKKSKAAKKSTKKKEEVDDAKKEESDAHD